MFILSMEFSNINKLSLCISKNRKILFEYIIKNKYNKYIKLQEILNKLLIINDIKLSDINIIGISIGPGNSYMGIRISYIFFKIISKILKIKLFIIDSFSIILNCIKINLNEKYIIIILDYIINKLYICVLNKRKDIIILIKIIYIHKINNFIKNYQKCTIVINDIVLEKIYDILSNTSNKLYIFNILSSNISNIIYNIYCKETLCKNYFHY